MGKKKEQQSAYIYSPNLIKRNNALLLALGGFVLLLYLISFVRMGQW
jgi:hypothetical protein